MMTAKQAFGAVRAANKRVNDRMLTLSELAKLKSETLGWDSDVTKFRKDVEQQLKDLPRGDKQKKTLRKQKADLSKAVSELRQSIETYQNSLRLARASKKDNKSAARFEKAAVQIEDAVRRMIEENPSKAAKFLQQQLDRAVVASVDTQDVEIVEDNTVEETISEEPVEA